MVAAFAPWNIPFPAPDPRCPGARKRWRDISGLHSFKRSGAAAAANSQSPAAFPSQRYGQNHVSPKPLSDKIPINGKPLAASRGFVLRRLSDAGLCTGPSIASGRHPKPLCGPCAGRDTGGKRPDPANRPWSRQAARKFIAAGLTEPPYRFERSTAAASSSGVTKWHIRGL